MAICVSTPFDAGLAIRISDAPGKNGESWVEPLSNYKLLHLSETRPRYPAILQRHLVHVTSCIRQLHALPKS